MTTSPSPEDLLLDRALAGDESAFVELVDLYHAPLLRFARTFVRQPAQAEDVVQDAWVGVLRGLERFERRSSLKTWLFRIVANRARTRAVREQRYVQFEVNEDGSDAGRCARPTELLLTISARHAVSVHTVGVSIGSASGVDHAHLARVKQLVDLVSPVLLSGHVA